MPNSPAPPIIAWEVVPSEYSMMEKSAKAGSELCGFVQKSLMRRNIGPPYPSENLVRLRTGEQTGIGRIPIPKGTIA